MLTCLLQKIRRKWILIWLLPYLLLCVGSEALHNHSPFQPQGQPHWHDVQSVPSVHADTSNEAFDFLSEAQLHSVTLLAGECLSCLWHSQTATIFFITLLASVFMLLVVRFLSVAPSLHAAIIPHFAVRGPPLRLGA